MFSQLAATMISLLAPVSGGETFTSFYSQPDYDRWNYSFNGTPGSRSVAPTFSAYGSGLNFDDRDGQVLLGWVTIDIPSGLPASAYTLKSLSVEISTTNDDIVFDPTLDDRDTHEVDGPADSDLGRPVCLSGVGFRGGFDPETYGEEGPQPFGAVRGQRNAYALAFLEDGTPIDISNNLTDQFDPMFFAVATSDDALPGELIPELGSIRFEINLDDPHISCYLKESLSFGTLDLMVTSLHPASQPGSGGEANYPNWIMKDNPLVELGAASAASMEIEVEIIEPSGVSGDTNGDAQVDVDDLLDVLGSFGPCPCCPSDFDGNGIVSVDEVLDVIAGWTG